MRGASWIVVLVTACGHPAPPVTMQASMPRLPPPAPISPNAPGAAYLSSVALQIQPGWGQFLDDCRFRLPATHPLNDLSLAARAELAIDVQGKVVGVELASSGNADFDKAVRDAIADAAPFPEPPSALWSDDDRVHLRWLFARDRRQAGPATAEVMTIELPLAGVVEKRLVAHDLTRAARRIARAPASDPDRAVATDALMIAALRGALSSGDRLMQRAAVSAVARAHVASLAPEVRALLATSDDELRISAMEAAAAIGDVQVVPVLLQRLATDVLEREPLALAETRALVGLGLAADAGAVIGNVLLLDKATPHAIALAAWALAPTTKLDTKLASWMTGDARTKAAVCNALAGGGPQALIDQGLRDRDATVRAGCARAAGQRAAKANGKLPGSVVARLRTLARDRDRTTRAAAIAALVIAEPGRFVRAADDEAAKVRAAYAAVLPPTDTDLLTLADDRDPDVRAAAWTRLALPSAPHNASLSSRAAHDNAPQVRLAAVAAIDDDELLTSLATSDDSPEVRVEALVHRAIHRGRVGAADPLIARFVGAPAGTDRVACALAWLLAR